MWFGRAQHDKQNKTKQTTLLHVDTFENKFQPLFITNLSFISLYQQLIYALCIAIVHILQLSTIYLRRRNVVCLFCLSDWNLSNQDASWCTLGIPLGSPWWARMQHVGSILFWYMVEKLFNIEQFFHWKLV